MPMKRRSVDVIPFPYTGNRLHPTQKPVEALELLVGAFCRPSGMARVEPDPQNGSRKAGLLADRLEASGLKT